MGFLEEQLKQILSAFMVDDAKSDELLDGAHAPLSSFSSRITACYALGLISEAEHHDLNLLRKIRNDFAHDIHASFDTQSVVDRCKLLKLKAEDYSSEKLGNVRIEPNGQFQTAAVALIMNFINRPHYVSKERRQAKSWVH
jgi:DNA-binding MltR family transcriptional regulator